MRRRKQSRNPKAGDSLMKARCAMKYLIAILLVALCACTGQSRHQASRPAELRPSGLDQIPPGNLGHPLGTYLTIEGERTERAKAGANTLLVDTVNGKKLAQPVAVWVDNAKHPGLPKAVRCMVRGYESGRMVGVPHGVSEAEKIPPAQVRFQFRKHFVMTSVLEPQTLERQWPPR